MIYTKNREGLEEYNIPEDWYKNRNSGISAMVRVKDEEEFIGPCLESILPFFDEIVIGLDCKDRTEDIIKSFINGKMAKIFPDAREKIKIYKYPFFLWSINGESHPDSIHDRAYYSNWLLSKTTKQIICKWDADMIMLPIIFEKKIREMVIRKKIVRICGYNPIKLEKDIVLSALQPIETFEPRFFHIDKRLFFTQNKEGGILVDGSKLPPAQYERFTYDNVGLLKSLNPLNLINNKTTLHFTRFLYAITRNDVYEKEPMFIHMKYMRKNMRLDRKQKEYNEIRKAGKTIDIELPDCLFKKPEDYLYVLEESC